MRNVWRLSFRYVRRLRRSKHAFVIFIGVTLAVYVILANDVIPEFRAFKPRSVVMLKVDDSNPQSTSRDEPQGRPHLGPTQLERFEPQSSNPRASINGTARPSKTRTGPHLSPNPPLHNANGSDATAALRRHNFTLLWHGRGNGSISSRNNSSSNERSSLNVTRNDSDRNVNVSTNANNVDNNDDDKDDGDDDKEASKDDHPTVIKGRLPGSSEMSKGGNAEGKWRARSNLTTTEKRDNSESSVLLAGVPRAQKVYLTIGMVTVKRDNADYFFSTMASLLQRSTPDEQRDITIVVMLADRDQSYNDDVLKQIKKRYATELGTGLLLVIRGPKTDYIFQNQGLKRTFDDSLSRVQWRSKQNIDYAAIMEFSAPLSSYYIHIEDDVLAADNYLRLIREFIKKNEKKLWAMLEVSPRGFIGKLFKSSDLPKLVMILRTFYLEQPCDFLMNYFMQMMTQAKHIVRTGSLFYHQGKISSLFNVTRKVDKLPVKQNNNAVAKVPRNFANPPAEVNSDLSVYQDHGTYNAYSLQISEFLWALDIKEGQRYTVVFSSTQRLKKLVIETGFSNQNQNDILQNGRVEMGTKAPTSTDTLLCPGAKTVGKFEKGHFDVTLKPPHDIKCFSVVILSDQQQWLIIREIVVITE